MLEEKLKKAIVGELKRRAADKPQFLSVNSSDAFLWFDETSVVTPLGPHHVGPGLPDTYPSGCNLIGFNVSDPPIDQGDDNGNGAGDDQQPRQILVHSTVMPSMTLPPQCR